MIQLPDGWPVHLRLGAVPAAAEPRARRAHDPDDVRAMMRAYDEIRAERGERSPADNTQGAQC